VILVNTRGKIKSRYPSPHLEVKRTCPYSLKSLEIASKFKKRKQTIMLKPSYEVIRIMLDSLNNDVPVAS
jgi:hypothetical protein